MAARRKVPNAEIVTTLPVAMLRPDTLRAVKASSSTRAKGVSAPPTAMPNTSASWMATYPAKRQRAVSRSAFQ
jgi:hypothetical protein